MDARSLSLITWVVLAGCTTAPAPEGTLLGRFGGPGAEINASADRLEVRYRCEMFRAAGPIQLDADGRFAAQLKAHPENPSLSATMTARLDGAAIVFEMFTVYPTVQTTAQFTVRRGVAPDYRIFSCRAPGPWPAP